MAKISQLMRAQMKSTPTPGWASLQRRDGCDFLKWLEDRRALRSGFDALASALQAWLEARVRTWKDVCEVWAAIPAVMSRCNSLDTYRTSGAATAYAWLHLLDRYVRTWLALEALVKQAILPMGSEGVRALDVGTGPGPSAFAVHDFYAAMMRYAEVRGSESWRQPAQLKCVESAIAMNRIRHYLAEKLALRRSRTSVLSVCESLPDFESLLPRQERRELREQLLRAAEEYWDDSRGEWASDALHTREEAEYLANSSHRYRLFVFSNFLTEERTLERFGRNLKEILTDAGPGSVLLVIGGQGSDYPRIYGGVEQLARRAGFERQSERRLVSSSAGDMGEIIWTEGARFYRRLRDIGGHLPTANRFAQTVKDHFEDKKRVSPRKSAVHAYRKMAWMSRTAS